MHKLIIITIAIALFGAGCTTEVDVKNNDSSTGSQTDSKQEESNSNSKLFDLEFIDDLGNTVTLADYDDKPIIINSWATWCPFCVDELPDFAEIQKEYKDSITIIAINRSESLNRSKQFTDDLGLSNDLVFLLDSRDKFYQTIGGFSMPETLFIDANRNTVEHKRGVMQIDEIRKKIKDNFEI
jgi:thiol-disulfide isomerase/thioredoxin